MHRSRELLSAGKVALSRTRRALPAAIEISNTAAVRIKELLENKPGMSGIRLGLKTRGCNGVSYTMTYAESKGKFEEEVADKGVRVFIEPSALLKITGTTMDWLENDTAAEFVFSNPQAKGVCGCGESFNT